MPLCGCLPGIVVAALKFNRYIVVVCAYKPAAALKMSYFHNLGFGELENILYSFGFVVFKIKYYFSLAVIYNALSVFAAVKRKKIV